MSSKPLSSESDWLLIIGCGYVGAPFAKQELARGTDVFAITRSQERACELTQLGVSPIVGSWLEQDTYTQLLRELAARDLASNGRVVVSVPHRAEPVANTSQQSAAENNEESTDTHVRGLVAMESVLKNRLRQVVYLSTTGVYGQQTGRVDEQSDVAPTRIGPRIAVEAERFLAASKLPSTVLRLAGIYGPGRIPLASKLRAGESLAVPKQGYLNLIHVDDIVRSIAAVFENPQPGPLYVLSDNHPVQRFDFYTHLAKLCGIDAPEFVEPDESSTRAKRAGDKQVDSSKFWKEHCLAPRMSDFCVGLADSLGR